VPKSEVILRGNEYLFHCQHPEINWEIFLTLIILLVTENKFNI